MRDSTGPVALPYGLLSRLHQVRSRVAPAFRQVVYGGRPSWTREPNTLPWFDQPDALERVAGADAEVLRAWVHDGYVVVDGLVDHADIDAMVATLDGLWDARAAVPHLVLLDLHDEVLTWDGARRARVRAASDWRIHGFHYVNAPARRIFHEPRLRAFASRMFGRSARPFAAINFMKGSRQHLHQDMGVFHIYPHNYLIGAWIACEDVAADSGPLVLYPGSHRAPFFAGFADYPQTNLRTAD